MKTLNFRAFIKMKKLLTVFLAAILCFSLFACTNNTEQTDKYPYLTYEIDEESDTIAITGYDAKTIKGDLIIPDKIDGLPVTKISKEAFRECKTLSSVVVPESVNSIGTDAFKNCAALKTAVLPDGLATIPIGLFSGCAKLEEVNIPKTTTAIAAGAFSGCEKLRHVVFPDCLEYIYGHAFEACFNLSVVIPSNTKLETEALTKTTIDGAYGGIGCVIVDDSIVPQFNSFKATTIYAAFKETPDSWYFNNPWIVSDVKEACWTSTNGYSSIFYGCELKENDNGEKYVYSVPAEINEYTKFGKTYTYYSIPYDGYSVSSPYRDGYEFLGWAANEGKTTPDFTKIKLKTVFSDNTSSFVFAGKVAGSDNEQTIPFGSTLYTVWKKL